MPFLEIKDISMQYSHTAVLRDLSLDIHEGELLSLLGPSGCGKTTLLRVIAGLAAPGKGRVLLGGRDITALPAFKRNIGVVFQNYALFPHLTVHENVEFGLRATGMPRAERQTRAAECLGLVRMDKFSGRAIQHMSGGQQQRVAIARAIATRPSLLLLDEPLSALDRKLRDAMQVELRQLFRRIGCTVIFVTHDQDEAMGLSDRIAVMKDGAFEQIASPSELYRQPASRYVLDFVGQSNQFEGKVVGSADGIVTVSSGVGLLKSRGAYRLGSSVVVGVRPEAIRLSDAVPANGMTAISATLVDWSFQGSRVNLVFGVPAVDQLIRVESDASHMTPELQRGSAASLCWKVEDSLLFPMS